MSPKHHLLRRQSLRQRAARGAGEDLRHDAGEICREVPVCLSVSMRQLRAFRASTFLCPAKFVRRSSFYIADALLVKKTIVSVV
jgi:hypothetical protein